MTLQHIFYLIASITLGMFLLFIIAATAIMFSISKEITRLSRKVHLMTEEAHSLFRNGNKYLSASLGAGIFTKIFKLLKNRS